MRFFNHYKTIVISDIPLGASPDYFKKLIHFIKNTSCDKLIFCGDIIKGWQSKKIDKFYKFQNKFLKILFKIAERDNTQIIFVTGDEWDYKEKISIFKFSNISFVGHYTFTSGGNTFYVIPGDISNHITKTSFKILQTRKLKYDLLIWLNKKYNQYRISKGQNYYSLLKKFNIIIDSETTFNNLIEDYKSNIVDIAVNKNCDGIICAHPVYSGIYYQGGITFLSPGFWTESLTGLAESNYGKWKVIDFEKVMEEKTEATEYAEMQEELFRAAKIENI